LLEHAFNPYSQISKPLSPSGRNPKRKLTLLAASWKLMRHIDEKPIYTEDYAAVLIKFENGARGIMTVSQVSSGRKNRLYYEINGSESSLVWDSETPNQLVIGHRPEPNQLLIKDPSLMTSSCTMDGFISRRSCRRIPGHLQTIADSGLSLHRCGRF
jgi:hypothetical protein